MTTISIAHALVVQIAWKATVTVRGWAHPPRLQGRAELRQRQRRFLLRADPGVAPDTCPTTNPEVKHPTTGCAVIATGTLG